MPLLRALSQRAVAVARAPRGLQPRRLHRRALRVILPVPRRQLGRVQRLRQHAGVRGDHAAAGNRRRRLQRDARVRAAGGHHAVAGQRRAAARRGRRRRLRGGGAGLGAAGAAGEQARRALCHAQGAGAAAPGARTDPDHRVARQDRAAAAAAGRAAAVLPGLQSRRDEARWRLPVPQLSRRIQRFCGGAFEAQRVQAAVTLRVARRPSTLLCMVLQ